MKETKKRAVQRTDYTVPASNRILNGPVRLAFLSDLHSEDYGNGQKPVLEILEAFQPHAVLIGGDAYDERRSWDKTSETVRLCAERWPTCYTPGNHETKTGSVEKCKEDAVSNGASVLAGTFLVLEADGSQILLCGAEDPLNGEELYRSHLDACARAVSEHPSLFSVMMTHRPERREDYKTHPADLILTGHAHGGQWRCGLFPNGLFAPDQGILPKFTGGELVWERNRMICSRGLGNVTPFPRFGNPPEVLCITVTPAE